jgi:L-cysteine:1D-myo-inositol 2-amino-2-deoxy-alpha-D-glucopyranoside ligase
MGHAATYVAFDLLNRAWRAAGHRVTYVQNVTDVDDPLLERAIVTGQDWTDLATREIDLFREDMEALRVLPPDHYIGAVESIPLVIAAIERLQEQGAVYDVDGDLYFSVHADPGFGGVSGLDGEEMLRLFGERGGDPGRPGKKHRLDCLLWQRERPGDPSWESPFGRGRPGWHIECSAISLTHLGTDFDVQGGGSDLVFPHHEMSASEAAVGHPGMGLARAFVHAGMVAYQGEKMSKSRGNLVFVSKLRQSGIDPVAIRLVLLGQHYRSDWEWTDDLLTTANGRLDVWSAALREVSSERARRLVDDVRAALADDLDAPRAVACIDACASEVAGDGTGAEMVRALLDASLGVVLTN